MAKKQARRTEDAVKRRILNVVLHISVQLSIIQ